MPDYLEWEISEKDKTSKALLNRNLFAQKYKDESFEKICDIYTGYGYDEIENLVNSTQKHILGFQLKGTGIELGAGTGLFSSILVKNNNTKMYALEYVDDVVKYLQPITQAAVLDKSNENLFISVIGSFDNIELADESLDFAIEFHSLHHSFNLEKTVKETYRILKKGGILIGFDRVRDDSLTDEQVELELDSVYNENFLKRSGFPLDEKLTRRMNGEHEYRKREWKSAFEAAGFTLEKIVYVGRSAQPLFKSIIQLLTGRKLGNRRLGSAKYEIKKWIKQIGSLPVKSPINTTIFVIKK